MGGGVPFDNLDYLLEGIILPGKPGWYYGSSPKFNWDIPPGKPDWYYGSLPDKLNRDIRCQIAGSIVPCADNIGRPIAPSFFFSAKGRDETLASSFEEAFHHGALGARGIHHLQSYGHAQPVYDNNAYTLSAIYQTGCLSLYAAHVSRSIATGRPEYHVTLVSHYWMNAPDDFRAAVTAYRNARDGTAKRREEFIDAANAKGLGLVMQYLSLE